MFIIDRFNEVKIEIILVSKKLPTGLIYLLEIIVILPR